MYPKIPVNDSISMCFVDYPMEQELRALILKNRDRITPWFWWSVGSDPDTNIRAFIETYKKDAALDKSLSFIIFVERKIVGLIDVFDIMQAYDYSARMGYWLDKDYTGQGIMTQSMLKVVDYMKWRFSTQRFEILTSPQNFASIRLAERCGFVHEGTRRKAFGFEGKFYDLAVYGLIIE